MAINPPNAITKQPNHIHLIIGLYCTLMLQDPSPKSSPRATNKSLFHAAEIPASVIGLCCTR